MKKQLKLAILALALLLPLAGCFLTPTREINLLVTRPAIGGSDVTVTYRMPAPKTGQVYVLWIVNPDAGKQQRVGKLDASSTLKALKTHVDFWATGAVVSIESTTEVVQMSNTWALCSGQICAGASTAATASGQR